MTEPLPICQIRAPECDARRRGCHRFPFASYRLADGRYACHGCRGDATAERVTRPCRRCGVVGEIDCFGQETRDRAAPWYRWCATGPCADTRHAEQAKARAAALAARPRCEVDGCRRAETWRLAGVGMCGRHKTACQRARQRAIGGMGWLAMFGAEQPSRDEILRLAVGG